MLLRSLYVISRIYKMIRRYFQVRSLIKANIEFYHKYKSSAKIFNVSTNVFVEIAQFMDVDDIALFSETCRKAKHATDNDVIWRKHYHHTYQKYSIIQNRRYKQVCIDGYISRKNEDTTISQEDRDWIVGWRMIIVEEFTASLIALPHLMTIPAKMLAVALYGIKLLLLKLYVGFLRYSRYNLTFKELEGRFSFNGYDIIMHSNIRNFWRIHDVFTDAILNIFVICSAIIAYHYNLIIYYFYYFLSGRKMLKIIKNEDTNMLRSQNHYQFNLAYGYLQLICVPVFAFLLTFPFFGITLVWWHYLDDSFINCFIGPKCINLFFYYTAINIDLTALDLKKFFPLFKPTKGMNIISHQAHAI